MPLLAPVTSDADRWCLNICANEVRLGFWGASYCLFMVRRLSDAEPAKLSVCLWLFAGDASKIRASKLAMACIYGIFDS